MTDHLSISRAWDETRARLASDGRLLLTVALALVALPAAIAEFIAPSTPGTPPSSVGQVVLMIAVGIVGIVGQLALVRLSYGSAVSVGEAIGHGARRTLPYIGAVLLILLGAMLLMAPFVALAVALGLPIARGTPPSGMALLLIFLFILACLYFAVRLMPSTAVASAEPVGPWSIVKRSWQLTGGHFWRLLGFVLLFLFAVIVVLGAISLLAGLLGRLLSPDLEPMSVGALLVVLVKALASAAATTFFVVMVTRIYIQLAGEPAAEVSVPSSGD